MFSSAFLVLLATCEVRAQFRAQWGDSNPRFGVADSLDCICNAGDHCERRPNGLFMCRISGGGRLYTPIQPALQGNIVGQGHIVGQVQANHAQLASKVQLNHAPVVNKVVNKVVANQFGQVAGLAPCCQAVDYTTCAVGSPGLDAYIGGRVCEKFYFNGYECQLIQVYTACVATQIINPRNLFDDMYSCKLKCPTQGIVNKALVNQPLVVNAVGQPIVSKAVVGQDYVQPLVSKALVGQPIVSKALVGQPIVSKAVVGQDYVQPIVSKAAAVVGQPLVKSGLGVSKSIGGQLLINSGLGAPCCQATDSHICEVKGLHFNTYSNGQVCNKFYFDRISGCLPIRVYTDCVTRYSPKNLFDNKLACQAKCKAQVGQTI